MEAKELMIGDWISISPNTKYKPFLIQADIEEIYFCNKFWPIPLTEEMLKANGFHCGSRDYTYWPDEDGVEPPFNILHSKIHGLRICISYRTITLQYVHELQHALRLCGLNELANNFKIE